MPEASMTHTIGDVWCGEIGASAIAEREREKEREVGEDVRRFVVDW